MEHFSDTAIVLKNFKFKDRDLIVVCLTQNHGKITAIAKNAINARRFGGSLDFLSCSKMEFIQKPHAEMARIDSSSSHFEFENLQKDFERFTTASFLAEFCLKLLEERGAAQEMYTVLSNALYYLNAGAELKELINAFLCKSFKIMGYTPNLLRCVSCNKGAHEVLDSFVPGVGATSVQHPYFWASRGGGMVCFACVRGAHPEALRRPLKEDTLLLFHQLMSQSFKVLFSSNETNERHEELFPVLVDFLHHYIPGLPVAGFKSWQLLNQSLITA